MHSVHCDGEGTVDKVVGFCLRAGAGLESGRMRSTWTTVSCDST